MSDNSLFTHIATGRIQAAEGLPDTNPFLWTSSDFPVPSWWWSALLGRAEQAVGLGGVRFVVVAFAAALGCLVVRVSRPADHPDEPSSRLLAQVLPPTVTLVILLPFLNGRPHLAGFVCLALALVVWRERLAPWWLVALFAVWVNVHGSWLYGIGVLVLLGVADSIDLRRPQWDRLRWLAASAGGLLLGGLAYPQRFRLVLLPTEQFGDAQARHAMRVYREWQPPGFDSPLGWVFAVVVMLALYGVLRCRKPSAWGTAAVVVVLAAMGLGAMRLLPIAAITLSAYAATGIEGLSRIAVPGRSARGAMVGLGAAMLVVASLGAWRRPMLDLDAYPVAEVDWLEERGLVTEPDVVVVAPADVGNYLELRFGKDANAWVDDRASAETFLDYSRLKYLETGWRESLAEAGPDVVLWNRDEPLADELAGDQDWVKGLTTDRYLVLCRAGTVGARCG
jgi:hypothetical protein